MEQTPPLLSNLLLSSPPLLFSQLVSCDICSAATWISSCQRRKEGGKRMESNRVTMQGLPKGGVRGTDNQQLLGVQQGETGLCVRVCIHVYMCMSMCERLSVNILYSMCARVCVRMAACEALPSGCLTELFSLTGRLIAVAAPRLCQTLPWGHGGNRQSTCLCTHKHKCVCV